MPVGAASNSVRYRAQQQNSATAVNATIYITNGTLAPIFQSKLDAAVPGAVSSAISSIVGKVAQARSGLGRADGKRASPALGLFDEPDHAIWWTRHVHTYVALCRRPTAHYRQHVGQHESDQFFHHPGQCNSVERQSRPRQWAAGNLLHSHRSVEQHPHHARLWGCLVSGKFAVSHRARTRTNLIASTACGIERFRQSSADADGQSVMPTLVLHKQYPMEIRILMSSYPPRRSPPLAIVSAACLSVAA